MKRIVYIFSFCGALGMMGCGGGNGIDLSDTPSIELVSVSPSQVREFEDEITFVIDYTDGDGDLGSNEAGAKNLFIEDSRIDEVTHEFRIKQLAPDGDDIPIQGTLNVTLPNTIITDGSAQETVTFTVYVVDRAGNESNRVESPVLTVVE